MKTTSGPTDSEALAAVLAAHAEAAAGEHRELETLLAYHAGTLAPEDAARVQDHLVGCRRCAATLLELERFLEEPAGDAGGDGVVDLAAVAGWRDFRRRLDPPERPAARRPGAWRLAAVAALIAAVLGLAARVAQLRDVNVDLRETVAALSAPAVNPPSFRVGELRRGAEEATIAIDVPPGEAFIQLGVEPPARFAVYEIAISDREGRSILRTGPHPATSAGILTLRLARPRVPAGDYRIEVWGLDDGRRDLLIERSLRIRYR